MLKENGLKSRVRLQQHVWSKDIELDGESFQSNATTGMVANSKLFFVMLKLKINNFLAQQLLYSPYIT